MANASLLTRLRVCRIINISWPSGLVKFSPAKVSEEDLSPFRIMDHLILNTGQIDRWMDYLSRLPGHIQDIYASPYYYETYQAGGHGIAECFIYEESGKFVLYPYLRNSVSQLGLIDAGTPYSDIQGAYGYNGPLTNCPENDFLQRFSNCFMDYCRSEHIVAEFTRFNPVFENHRWLPHAEISKANEVVNIDLRPPPEILWTQSYDRDVRRIVTKGKESGYWDRTVLLKEAPDQDFENFRRIYFSTLDRNQADEFYYFTEDFFAQLKQKLSQNILLSVIYLDEQAIGASINPYLGIIGYGFLGGSLHKYRQISPFTYMMHKVAGKLKELGVQNYLLGGGIRPGDRIFQYKKSFASGGVRDFFIGKKIHIRDIYDILCRAWEEKTPGKSKEFDHFILKYRY